MWSDRFRDIYIGISAHGRSPIRTMAKRWHSRLLPVRFVTANRKLWQEMQQAIGDPAGMDPCEKQAIECSLWPYVATLHHCKNQFRGTLFLYI